MHPPALVDLFGLLVQLLGDAVQVVVEILAGFLRHIGGKTVFLGNQLNGQLGQRVVDDAAIRAQAFIEFQRIIGHQRSDDDIDHAVVELGGEVRYVRSHRGSTNLGHQNGLGFIIFQHCYTLAGRLGQGVDFPIVHEHIGGTGRGYPHDLIGALGKFVCSLRMGQYLQYDFHVLHGGDGANGVDGAGILIEITATDAGDQGGIADASLEILSGNGFVGMGNQFHFQVPAQGCGLPIFHGAHDRSNVADDVKDADLAFNRFGLGSQRNGESKNRGDGGNQLLHGCILLVIACMEATPILEGMILKGKNPSALPRSD